jgi:cell division protein ZapA
MARVAVTIAGKTYRIDCDDGDEPRLTALAEVVDRQIETMRSRFGEIGDQRLLVMAAITIADELVDMTRRARDFEALAQMREAEAAVATKAQDAWAERALAGIEQAAGSIERMASEITSRDPD